MSASSRKAASSRCSGCSLARRMPKPSASRPSPWPTVHRWVSRCHGATSPLLASGIFPPPRARLDHAYHAAAAAATTDLRRRFALLRFGPPSPPPTHLPSPSNRSLPTRYQPTNQAVFNRIPIVAEGTLEPLISYVKDEDSDLIGRQYCAMCLGNLAAEPENHEEMVKLECIDALMTVRTSVCVVCVAS